MAVLTVRAGALWNRAAQSQKSFALLVSVVDTPLSWLGSGRGGGLPCCVC